MRGPSRWYGDDARSPAAEPKWRLWLRAVGSPAWISVAASRTRSGAAGKMVGVAMARSFTGLAIVSTGQPTDADLEGATAFAAGRRVRRAGR
jgi:hypothetical protein